MFYVALSSYDSASSDYKIYNNSKFRHASLKNTIGCTLSVVGCSRGRGRCKGRDGVGVPV